MVQLVDYRGNPIKAVTEEAQTDGAKVQQLHKTYADHPSRGLTPYKLAGILTDAEQGNLIGQCELAEDMEEKDGHIFAELSKRKRALITVDYLVTPPHNATAAERKAADFLSEILQEVPDLEDVIFDMADGISKGYANQEIEWLRLGNTWVPEQIHFRDPSWFTVDEDTRSQLMLRTDDGKAEALQPFGWISHIHKAKSGYLARAGLSRILAWPYLFKNFSVRDLAEFLEIYGLPLRLGQYPPGSSDKEKATLLKAIMSIGHNAGGIIPQGMVVDFHDAAKGASEPFEAMIAWCERTQSKAILGGTLTSQADGKTSTNALGNVHNDVRVDLRNSDLKQIASTLTRDLLWPLLALNSTLVSDPRRCPRLVFDTQEPEDISLLADAVPKLVNGVDGFYPSAEWLHLKSKIPKAAKGETPLRPRTAQPTALMKHLPPGSVAALDNQDVSQNYVDQLDDVTLQANTDMINQIRALVDSAESLEAIRDGLLALHPNLDDSALASAMEEALTAATLAGRFELLHDAE